jgi:RNA polymerase sigma-70 factor (ECF subfamily)
MGSLRPDVELEVRERARARDWDGATSAALRGYGPEVLEFLAALHRNETDANEVFSLFAEGTWRGLERFAWESSVRTWLYAVARRSSLRHRRDGRRRAAREAPLPEGSSASILVAKLRSKTGSLFATDRRSRIAALRDALPVADQTLLMLRVDRQLAWRDLVRVLHEDDATSDGSSPAPLDEATLTRETARLRKRFQLVKDKLHALAREQGLVSVDKDGS